MVGGIGSSTYTYDSGGNMLTSIREDWQGTTWINKWRGTNTYDINGFLLISIQEYWQNTNWIPDKSFLSIYSNRNEIGLILAHSYEASFVYFNTGIEDILAVNNDVSIYPNPLHSQAKIEIEKLSPGEAVEFYLFDFLGREVYKTTITSSPYILKRQGLPDGMYLWKAVGRRGTASGKLVME